MHEGLSEARRSRRSDSTLQARCVARVGEVLPDAVGRAMNQPTTYTPYHPRWHRTRVSTYWWMQRASYLVFILRELSSVFVAWFVVYLLVLVRALSQGES